MCVIYFLIQTSTSLYMYVLAYVLTFLLLSVTEARYVRRRYEPNVEDCQFTCNTDVYKCDLRCKYLKDLHGTDLKKCHVNCADTYLDCFMGCFSLAYSPSTNLFADFGFKWFGWRAVPMQIDVFIMWKFNVN